MEGSPIRREDVISAGVQNCLMCLILSSALQSKATDPNLVDKETILSFLQIKGCRGTETMVDTPNTTRYRLSEKPIRNRSQIPIISEIVNDSNVQFMEKSKDSAVGALYMALPFTRGQAFIVSVLDAILSLTFYNEKLMSIIRTLITGVGNHKNDSSDSFEESAPEQSYYQPWLRTRMSCRIAQISLKDERFSRFRVYGELFVHLLHNYSMLALGLYRSYTWANKGHMKNQNNEDRYVTTAPSYDAKLRPNDKVFVLAQSEMELVCPIELGRTDLENSSSDEEPYIPSPRRNTKLPEVSVPIAVEEVPSPEPTPEPQVNNVAEHIELNDVTYFGDNDTNHKVVDNPLIVETSVPSLENLEKGAEGDEVTEIKSNDAAHLIA